MTKPFIYRYRVGYYETDQAGIVHHSMFLQWLERARVEFLRENGVEYASLEYDKGFALPVVETKQRFRRPAKFDDQLAIEVTVGELKTASLRFDYRIMREDTLLAEASVRLACIKLPEARPARLPAIVRAAAEAGLVSE